MEIARRRKRDANDRVGLDAHGEKSAPDREPDAIRQPFRPQGLCLTLKSGRSFDEESDAQRRGKHEKSRARNLPVHPNLSSFQHLFRFVHPEIRQPIRFLVELAANVFECHPIETQRELPALPDTAVGAPDASPCTRLASASRGAPSLP